VATVTRVRRVANPRRKKNVARRRKLTPKQIKFFGTSRQKAALKAKRREASLKGKRKHTKRTKPNPARRKVVTKRKPTRKANRARKTKKAANRRRSPNPALVLTLGAINPRKRSKSVAKGKKKKKYTKRAKSANPRRTKKRKNPTRVVVYKTKPVKHHRKRNPIDLFGQKTTAGLTKVIAAGLVGVAAAKFLPTLLPATFVSSNITRTIATAVAAWVSGFAAAKVTDKNIGDAVMFGGFMQTASVALNAFLPSIGKQVGLGELMPGRFPVPQNPLLIPAPAAVAGPAARIGVSGLNRAFGSSF
jgi:hypothetical protein